MDFGIARFNRETDKTISEKAIGSVHYISPEQARGEATDEKSDIYSVGVMLFEMLTGRKPFDGDNPVSIALMHMQTKPKKPKEINSSIPDGLEEITLKAMQKEAVKRYQTAGEMMNDIEEFKKNPSIVFEYKYFSTDQNAKYFDKPSANSGQLPPQKDLTPPKGLTAGHDDEDDDEDFDDYYDEVVERRSPLLAILFATASVFVIMTAWLIYSIVTGTILEPPDGSGREMRMPMLIGMDYDEARREYPELNFNPTQEYSTDFLNGQIMAQSMAEGRTFRTSQQIGVVVSKGPELVELDRFEGGVIHIDEVLARLRNQGFPPPAIRPMEDETIPENFVIRTEPAGGEMIERSTRITIWVSDGNASMPTAVPNFVGQTLVLAESRAKMHDLVLVVEYEHHETVEEGKVISQDIPVETRVDRQSEVTVIISLGPELERTGSIDFTVNVTGRFFLRYYIDGIQVREFTQHFGTNNRILWEFTGTESRVDYAIEVESAATGRVGMFCRFEYDFTSANPNATRKQILLNEGIFTYLSEPDAPFTPPAENGDNGEDI
jgi:serine/threonine-protein kinase